ncbi:AAA family ATPase [Clostridium cellulovorans]|uniref:Nuclease SbcCD subunit C n=1 Tax=Clostridium cellulovorans (strain ATCC 35296 / DSM 3052 / OCM 3 / 743B) TaxID=573061 RepID=D9SRM5_CLOC7|nr:AAA family ATPase [Clostridium cellulovorans]ADL50392.1 SMC domain protein [Clostridium cellulovorans 743B]
MRPVKLVLSAFGPYSGVTEIDFTLLGDKNIFLVTGPTGSGKTTIFDAICYALYGETSGNMRSGKELRSDFIDEKENHLTYVEFIFNVKGEDYYIKRVPQQMRKKLSGSGETMQNATIELRKLAKDEKPLTKDGDVKKSIDEIMGINAEQFRKIIMIPQGDFRDFLCASTKEKETILRKIFNTEPFKRIQDKLALGETKIRNTVNELTLGLRETFSLVDCGDNNNLKNLIINRATTGEIVDLLKEQLLKDINEENKLKLSIEELDKVKEEKLKVINEIIETNKKFDQKEEIKKLLTGLMNKKSEIIEKEKLLDSGIKAQKLLPFEKSYIERKQEQAQVMLANEKGQKDLDDAKVRFLRAEEELKGIENLKSATDEKKESFVKLTEWLKEVELLEEKKNAINKSSSVLERYRTQLKNEKENIISIEGIIETLLRKEKFIDENKLQHQKIIFKYKEMEENHKLLGELYKLSKFIVENKQVVKESSDKLKALEENLVKDKRVYEEKNDFIINSSSILLARELVEGEPCPVCGSKEHPSPRLVKGDIPTKEEMRALTSEIDKKQRDIIGLSAVINELQGKIFASMETLKQKNNELIVRKLLVEGLDIYDYDNVIAPVGKNIAKNKEQLRAQKEELEKEIDKSKHLTEEIDKNKGLLKGAKEKETKLNDLILEVSSKLAKEQEALQGIYLRVPKEYHEITSLSKAIEILDKEIKNNEILMEKLQNQYNDCKTYLEKAISTKEILEKNLEVATSQLENTYKQFEIELLKLFENAEEYKLASGTINEIERLELEIREYNDAIKLNNDIYMNLEKELGEAKKVDVTVLEEEINMIKGQIEDMRTMRDGISSRLKRNRDILNSALEKTEAIRTKEEEYKILGELANLALGKGAEKVTFETFVLGNYFDDVIASANIRLMKMTGGRFYLVRREEEGSSRGRKGLDLDIFDNYTGKARPVNTLSGGESFKAALALALGLSDEVQNNSGGIELNTMFIDEGFGTLDSESLDNAIRCLLDLEKSGRLVGIISHVDDLKERITSQLQIKVNAKGSSAEFKVW